MMKNEELRSAFRTFCGEDRYRQFLETLNTVCRRPDKGRLLHWQETLWKRFCQTHSDCPALEFEDIQKVFGLCHVHLLELQDDEVEAVYGYWRLPRNFTHARETLFPFANMIYMGDSGEKQRWSNRHVRFCSRCRDELVRWNAERNEKIGLPAEQQPPAYPEGRADAPSGSAEA